MSLNATISAAPAAASSASFHPHGHKRGVHNDSPAESGTAASPGTSGQTPATTEGLFGTLLSSLAQVAVGVNPIASVAISALTPTAAAVGTTSTAMTASSTLGGNVNAKV
jgi:hypothetical protein